MKKLTAILLAMGLTFTGAILTACDGAGDPSTGDIPSVPDTPTPATDTEVTKEEFEAAFKLGENYVCSADIVFEGLGIQRWQFKRAGNLLESSIARLNADYTPYEGEHTTYNYVEKNGETIYDYTPSVNQDGSVNYYSKEESQETFEEHEYEDLGALLMPIFANFDLYTYNTETQAYEAAHVEISDTMSADNLSWKFVDNKLVSGSYVMNNGDGVDATEMPVEFTITYGNATIVLPTNVQN